MANNVGGTEEVRAFYNSLPPDSRLKKEIDQARELLKSNASIGNRIERRKIPKKYIKDYKIDNLWRYKLGEGYRLVYTVLGTETARTCSIMAIMNHTDYGKLFGYD